LRFPSYFAILGMISWVPLLFCQHVVAFPLREDFHYPQEETSQHDGLVLPVLTNVSDGFCFMSSGGTIQKVSVGAEFLDWRVVGAMPTLDPPSVVLEQNFERWGALAILKVGSIPSVLRKSVGHLSGIRQPYFDFTSEDPDYFKKVADSQEDYAAQMAANLTSDGELDYPSLASMLAPTRDIVEISNAADVVKFIVTHNGRVKCASYHDKQMNGITDFDDLHAPMPNPQTIVFDPANHTSFWPRRFENSKTGLVGSHLRIANVGSFSPSNKSGFELIAFSPISKFQQNLTAPAFVSCHFDGPVQNSFIAGCSQGCKKFQDLLDAKRACIEASDCNGVTLKNGNYELRAAQGTVVSPGGEVSWSLRNGDSCNSLCDFSAKLQDAYLADCSQGCQVHQNLDDAEQACAAAVDCGGVTLRQSGHYELRQSNFANASSTGEASWLLRNPEECHASPSPTPPPPPSPALPRRANVNYNPGVYVRFLEEKSSVGIFSYYYVSNGTRKQVDSSEFYAEFVQYQEFYSEVMSQGMDISLPQTDIRQADMAKSVLLAAWGNYVGDQSNYGNGGTYWSIGREDNGSLPLNVLSVEEANLQWGLCEVALPHIQFYHENYVRPDGSINYYSWGGFHDSYGDAGRLVSLFVQATQMCPDEDWILHNTPYAEHLARWILEKRNNATSVELPPHQQGLVMGVPEHDWHATKDKYFYSNNVVLLRGMEELGSFLLQNPGRNATFGNELLADAVDFRKAIMTSLRLCTVFQNGTAFFLPPIAETNYTPFERMTYGSWKSNRYPEYSNFRFYPETLLADVLPRELEEVLLHWHNHRGGRIGGASRWGNWLDDMPVTGWGFGALVNNQTDNFLALLYGHAATYQSRGTFHSTEQLSFQGEGWYRHFLHWPNPKPNATYHAGLQYYGNENDVSFCVVSEVIIARLTRWQLVFEDFYRPQFSSQVDSSSGAIWLARGAPKRWFFSGSGFNVSRAPTRFGKLSYQMRLTGSTAAFHVVVPTKAPSQMKWVLRWPFQIDSVECEGCHVLQVEAHGVATIVADASVFVARVQLADKLLV